MPDNQLVNIVSLLGVALVVAITYKALLLPLVVLIPIECAVFINTAMPYIYGQRTMFLGFIIVSCIQLGRDDRLLHPADRQLPGRTRAGG